MSNELVEALQKVQKWHQHQVDQLKMVTGENDIVLGDITLEPNTDLHKGFQMGVMVALNQLGELPFSIQTTESNDEQ